MGLDELKGELVTGRKVGRWGRKRDIEDGI